VVGQYSGQLEGAIVRAILVGQFDDTFGWSFYVAMGSCTELVLTENPCYTGNFVFLLMNLSYT
jgi:hypothetical protein